MKKLPYRSGTLFAVPLKTDGYTIGLVSRIAVPGKILLAYFFRLKFKTIPELSDLISIEPSDSIRILRIGDLGLVSGEWMVIGELPQWIPNEWPTPSFIRRDDLSKRAWKVVYFDNDPSKIEHEIPVPFDIAGFERDALYGSGAVEILLTKLLT